MKTLPYPLAMRIPIQESYGNDPNKRYLSEKELDVLWDRIVIGSGEYAYIEGKQVILVKERK